MRVFHMELRGRCFVGFLLALAVTTSASQLAQSDRANSMLAEAAELTNMEASNVPPFRLHVTFKFFSGSQGPNINGDLTIEFDSISHWRKEIKWGDLPTIE